MKTLLAGLVAAVAALALAAGAMADPHKVFLGSAVESSDYSTVTLPLYEGSTSDPNITGPDKSVWYVVTDSSSKAWAKRLNVNYAPRLAVAANTGAVQNVSWNGNGTLSFPATVDFGLTRQFVPDYTWYGGTELSLPAAALVPGAQGFAGYSPLLQLPDGTVLDAPQIANATGQGDKVVNLDTAHGKVVYDETTGFFDHHTVHYASFDASAAGPATLEDVTVAPSLNAAPPGDPALENTDASTSARAGIIAFTNGQHGYTNPNRQGLGSTLVDAPADAVGTNSPSVAPPVPLNVIQAVPTAGPNSLYSPLWDVHLARWSVPYAERIRQTSFTDIQALGAVGTVTQPDGVTRFGPAGAVANCPIISEDGPNRIVIQTLPQ